MKFKPSVFNASILFILILIFWPLEQINGSQFAFLPFYDSEKFKGVWNIKKDIPEFLSLQSAKSSSHCSILPFSDSEYFLKEKRIFSYEFNDLDLLQELAEILPAQYLLLGDIRSFGISRFGVITPMVGGYQSYSMETKINIKIFKKDTHSFMHEFVLRAKIIDRDLGLTLLGGPGGPDRGFRELEKISFQSPSFQQTIIGKALMEIHKQLLPILDSLCTMGKTSSPPDSLPMTSGKLLQGKILLVENNEVYLNLGSKDGLLSGEEFEVVMINSDSEHLSDSVTATENYQKIGKIKIKQIKSDHLAIADILETTQHIQATHIVRKLKEN